MTIDPCGVKRDTSHYPLTPGLVGERLRIVRSILEIKLSAIGESANHLERGRGGMSMERIMEICSTLNFPFASLCGPESIFIQEASLAIARKLEERRTVD